MKSEFEDVFLVTHKNCMDGSACAILFQSLGGKKENIYFSMPNHELTDEIVSDLVNHDWPGHILVADLSVSEDIADWLDKVGRVTLLDHHQSSIPLGGFSFCTINVKNKMCGAAMMQDAFSTSHKFREFVKLVDDNDRWIHNYPESKDLAALHELLGQELFIERFLKNQDVSFSDREKYIVEVYENKREISTRARKNNLKVVERNVQGHNVRVGFSVAYGDNTSYLGGALCTDPELGVDFVVIISGEGVSFRASSDCPVDVSVLAELNGNGGGHRGAAGTKLSGILGEDFLEMIVDRIKFE